MVVSKQVSLIVEYDLQSLVSSYEIFRNKGRGHFLKASLSTCNWRSWRVLFSDFSQLVNMSLTSSEDSSGTDTKHFGCLKRAWDIKRFMNKLDRSSGKLAHDCANFGKKNHNSQLSIRTREKYYKQPTTTLSNFKQTALSTGKSRVFKVGLVLVLHLIRNYGIDVSFRDPT